MAYGYHFVSIVGTQIMAILNPFLSLIENGMKLHKVTFLTTRFDKVRLTAETLERYMVEKGYVQKELITLINISDSLDVKDGLLPAHHYIREISKKDSQIIFNIAGGLNFQIAKCLYHIEAPSFHIIYPEADTIHMVTMEEDEVVKCMAFPPPRPLDVLDLLDLQGVKYRIGSKKHRTEATYLTEHRIRFPGAIGPLWIGRVKFDCVWNEGNSLVFLKFLIPGSMKKNYKLSERLLDETRDVIAFATTRTYLSELFHRDIIVITESETIRERIEKESRGKIRVKKNIRELAIKGNEGSREKDLPLPTPETFKTGNLASQRGTLYLVLGKDIFPALISIWSHAPKKVVCFYTPGDPQIEKYRNAIVAQKNLLPVEEVTFCQCSIFGSSICNFPVDDKEPDHFVNITSGTKSQTAFLTLFAKKNHMRIYSIKTQEERLTELSSGDGPALSSPDPLSLLLLSGQKVTERGYGTELKEILEQRGLYEGILSFFRTINDEKNTGTILTKGITTPEGVLSVNQDKEEMEIRFLTGERFVWSSKKNEWFENLIGYVMWKQGADDVRLRMLTARDDENFDLTEIDVVARFGASYFVISCKAGKSPTEKAALEIAAVARLFGRFAIPLLFRLQFIEEPRIVNGVYVIGFPTFSREERMKKALEEARLHPSTLSSCS